MNRANPHAVNASAPVHMTDEDGKTGPGGDRYSGLDSFGRVEEPFRIMGNVPRQNTTYGDHRASNRQWRRDDHAHDLGVVETAAVTNPSGVILPADDRFGNQTAEIAAGDSASERQVYMALILRPMSATNLNQN